MSEHPSEGPNVGTTSELALSIISGYILELEPGLTFLGADNISKQALPKTGNIDQISWADLLEETERLTQELRGSIEDVVKLSSDPLGLMSLEKVAAYIRRIQFVISR